MKKLFCLVLALCLLGIPFTASADQIYTGDGYSFAYPDTWYAGPDQQGIDFVLMMPDNASNLNMVAQDLNMAFTAEQVDQLLMPVLIGQYKEMFGGVSEVEVESPIVLGENTFSVIAFTITMYGLDMYMEQYVTMSGTMAYIFTATYMSADAALIAEVQNTLATLTVG